jgi:hypothetical protein
MILTFWIANSFAGNLIGVSGSEKFRIDDVTGIATSLGSVSIPDFGIDHASFQDRLYILSYNSSGGAARIYKENINSGTSNGYVDVSANVLRIACRSDGSLVGLTGSQILLINTATGGTSVIGSASIPYIGASDAKYQNMLYVLGADSPGGAAKIYQVNMAGAGVWSITPSTSPMVLGVSSDGTLLGVTSSQVFRIHTGTGQTTLLGSTSIGAFGLSECSMQNTLYVLGADVPGGTSRVFKIDMLTGSTTSFESSTMPLAVAYQKTPQEEPYEPVVDPTAVPAMNHFGYAAMLLLLPLVGFFALRKRKHLLSMLLLLAARVSQQFWS